MVSAQGMKMQIVRGFRIAVGVITLFFYLLFARHSRRIEIWMWSSLIVLSLFFVTFQRWGPQGQKCHALGGHYNLITGACSRSEDIAIPMGTVVRPPSSVEQPADIGTKGHTNVEIFVPDH
jgi:hypothetical protein